jgi:hypothetical protein
MDPSTAPRSAPRVSIRNVAFWAVAFVVGAYLGYKIAEALELSGLAVLSAIVGVLLGAAILVSLAVIAVIAALQPGGRGRSTAWTVTLAGLLLVAGLVTGWSLKELGFGSRQSVVREAQGTMSVSLDGIDDYVVEVGALAMCRSEPDGERVAFVESNAAGTVGTGVIGASLVILPQSADDPPVLRIWIVPADKSVGQAPSWRGPLGDVAPVDGEGSGHMEFAETTLSPSDETGLAPEGWPTTLSGTIDWRCGTWLPGSSAQP